MQIPEKIQRLGRTALLLFVLGAAAFLSAITTIRFAIQGRDLEVPSLIGLKAGDAQARVNERGLGFHIADRLYSETPVDHVVRQSPLPGAKVKVGQRMHVVLSLGPRKLPIPQLEGRSLRAARIELLRAGLQVGEVSSCHLPAAEPEIVVKQNPAPGEMETGSARVNLLVSLGAAETAYVMPDLRGLPLAEAQRRIVAAGFGVGKVTAVPQAAALPGTVIQQAPPRGARIVEGAPVELQVAE